MQATSYLQREAETLDKNLNFIINAKKEIEEKHNEERKGKI